MGFIKFSDGRVSEFYAGAEASARITETQLQCIEELQLDGDELDYASKCYPQFIAKGRKVQFFYGDIAKMKFHHFPGSETAMHFSCLPRSSGQVE